MDDFQGLLARDFGLKPQGKSAPMAPSRNSPAGGFSTFPSSSSFELGSSTPDFTNSSSSTRKKADFMPVSDDRDDLLFENVFGGSMKSGSSDSRARSPPSTSAFDYDAVFKAQNTSKSASMPVYDKPVYDEDIFEGIPGLKSPSGSASARYENVFASISSSPPKQDSSQFNDLLGNFGRKEMEPKKTEEVREDKKDTSVFDDLIPGFGRSPQTNRSNLETAGSQKASSDTTKTASNVKQDPFVVFESTSTPAFSSFGMFTDPLEEIGKFSSSGSKKADQSSVQGGVFDDLDPLDSLGKSVPETNNRGQERNHARTGSTSGTQSPMESSRSSSPHKVSINDFLDSQSVPSGSIPQTSSTTYVNPSPNEANFPVNKTSKSDENFGSSDDVWLTASEIPLFTQPTSAPPPSRPPPPRPARPLKKKVNEPSSFSSSTGYSHSPRNLGASQIDDFETFSEGRTGSWANGYPEVFPGADADADANSVAAESAAAMKEAMDRAEAKFRHAREMRENEYLKAARSREMEDNDYQERELREKQERIDRERLEKEKEKERERAHEMEREREERERELRKLERERIERERDLARQAVQRATREARERAAAEAHAKAQRVAVEKAAAEARERAERAAVQRAQAEARERAAAGAKERAEKAAVERANAEAREREVRARAERAAVERAAAEARERAAAEARERAAAQARAKQQSSDNDIESFFSGVSRPSSAPRQRENFSDPVFDAPNKGGSFDAARTSSRAASNIRKASSTTNIVDDLSSIFGAAASQSGEFQEVEGESEERRRARLERQQRTQERAAKALAEKNERDLQAQHEQAERHRIAETLDFEIKRWAAGKEGNLRALLSTLQYVLWPECGWQPVSLTDLITAASVKKVYRKATLCIHPDKVQQKGANLQQKYVAEKVFDLLKEAWNKFNSEELF